METLVIVVFVIGYLAIALEHPLKINKTASALLAGVVGSVEADLVGHGERADRDAGHLRRVLDQRRIHALGDHGQALVDVGADEAAGEEARAVVDHDRRLLHRLHQVERACQGCGRSLAAADDLDQRHAFDRREEVHADEVLGVRPGFG